MHSLFNITQGPSLISREKAAASLSISSPPSCSCSSFGPRSRKGSLSPVVVVADGSKLWRFDCPRFIHLFAVVVFWFKLHLLEWLRLMLAVASKVESHNCRCQVAVAPPATPVFNSFGLPSPSLFTQRTLPLYVVVIGICVGLSLVVKPPAP